MYVRHEKAANALRQCQLIGRKANVGFQYPAVDSGRSDNGEKWGGKGKEAPHEAPRRKPMDSFGNLARARGDGP